MSIEFTDRYQALGVNYPDRGTMCKGRCEGCGVYPLKLDEGHTEAEVRAWHRCHRKAHTLRQLIRDLWWYATQATWGNRLGLIRQSLEEGLSCDGWHFIECPDCKGTGLAPPPQQQESRDE